MFVDINYIYIIIYILLQTFATGTARSERESFGVTTGAARSERESFGVRSASPAAIGQGGLTLLLWCFILR